MDDDTQDPIDKAQLEQVRKDLIPFREISQKEDATRIFWANILYGTGVALTIVVPIFLLVMIALDCSNIEDVTGKFRTHDYKDVKWLEAVDRIESIALRICFVAVSIVASRFCFSAAERLTFQTPLFARKTESSDFSRSEMKAVTQLIKLLEAVSKVGSKEK